MSNGTVNGTADGIVSGTANGTANDTVNGHSQSPPRFIIIGAGARGRGYASNMKKATNGIVAAVAEPVKFKRDVLGKEFIWGEGGAPSEGQSFADWREFLEYETKRRERVAAGEKDVPEGIDGAFVCVLDELHRDVVVGLAPLGLHIMCEKPLSTNLKDCLEIYHALRPLQSTKVFSVGHVLRYSPHNLLLRKLLVEDRVIGDITSAVHTEPVGWWHFSHSFVRGNWRNDKTSAPTLLTKCCHDVDLLLWLLCSPEKAGQGEPHIPETVTSSGGVNFFKKSRKPAAAGSATNCLSCPLREEGCKYSAEKIYVGGEWGVDSGHVGWPNNIVVHDIEDYESKDDRRAAIRKALAEDWDETTPKEVVAGRNWFGRCVYETDNNVADEQFVTITWPESNRPAKQATLHMVAQTKRQCDRYSNFYGDDGEIYADSYKIVVENFATGEKKEYTPEIESLGHGGGDIGLTRQFVTACESVKNKGWEAEKAQNEFIGCTLEEAFRSHAMVFAAEEARLEKKVVDWPSWWKAAIQ